MNRHTHTNHLDKIFEYSFWLIFNSDGTMRLTRGEPDVSRNERAMKVSCTLPFALFSTPTLKANIAVGAPAVEIPQINLELAGDALKAALGVDFDLKIIPPEPLDG